VYPTAVAIHGCGCEQTICFGKKTRTVEGSVKRHYQKWINKSWPEVRTTVNGMEVKRTRMVLVYYEK
jgi:hypothetical protein